MPEYKSRFLNVTCVVTLYSHSFHSSMALQPFVEPWPLSQFCNLFYKAIGLLGGVISPSQGRYLYAAQHKHKISPHTNIHALSGIRTHDPSVRASEESSCLRTRGYCDRLLYTSHCNLFTLTAEKGIRALRHLN
jgi:Mn2+/Fe2+ NRAMP family transporter